MPIDSLKHYSSRGTSIRASSPINAKYSWNGLALSSRHVVLSLVQWRRREELIGKEIINEEAKKIGVAKDLAWTSEGALALIIETDDEEEAFLPFSEIERVGDVVFVKSKSTLQRAPTVTCPVCKHRNLPEAKFCAKCGKALGEKETKE
jgi:sporulation protein YlmC with PRC-barrel domain